MAAIGATVRAPARGAACASIRRTTRSPAGNASGQRSARIAMYDAVQAPMPGSARSRAIVLSTSASGSSTSAPSATACASATMARARAPVSPVRTSSATGAAASCSGAGKRCASAPSPVASGVPNAPAMRPSTVRAPRTDTCWPTIARTASSKPSKVPGTRSPGCFAASGPSASATCAGSQARSNACLTRDSTTGTTGASDAATEIASASCAARAGRRRARCEPPHDGGSRPCARSRPRSHFPHRQSRAGRGIRGSTSSRMARDRRAGTAASRAAHPSHGPCADATAPSGSGCGRGR